MITTPNSLPSEITLGLSPEAQRNLKILMDRGEHRSPEKLFRASIITYHILFDHIEAGGKVILRKKSGEELIFDPVNITDGEIDEE